MSEASNSEGRTRPLVGLKILDATEGPMRAAGRLLAELGAEVIRIRAPEEALSESASDSAYFDFGKSILDLAPGDPSAQIRELGASADIVFVSSLLVGGEELERLQSDLADKIFVAVSPFGLAGACADWQLTEPVFYAMSGVLSNSGNPGRPPLLPPPGLAFGSASIQLVLVALIAYWNKLRNGQGESIDFSVFDGAVATYDPGYGVAGSASAGVPAYKLPRGRPDASARYPIIPCKDGYVRICLLAKRQWQNMYKWMGEPEQFSDPKYDQLIVRFKDPDLIPAIAAFFSSKTREEIEAGGSEFGVPVAGLISLSEAIEVAHFSERHAFAEVSADDGKQVRLVNGMIEIDNARMGVEGLSMGEIAEGQFYSPPIVANLPYEPASQPLKGVKVLDLGVIVVGAEQGRIFADQGADVIKVETRAFPDGTRQSFSPTDFPAGFAAGNRGKRGLSINMRTKKGLDLFKELAKDADVVFSNYKPGTLEKLGIDYASLSKINPSIIVIENSAYGPSGSWSQRMGYGPLVRASTGLTSLYSYPDNPGEFGDALTVYPDHVGGRLGPIGALALMIERARTGKGGRVTVAQAEILLQHLGQLIAEGRERPAESDAPYGVFPAQGDDEWVVVSVEGDAQWQSLCKVIDNPKLAADPALATAEGRRANRAVIDEALIAWLGERAPDEAAKALQSAGVPAAHMLRISELPDSPPFRDRRILESYNHPLIREPVLMERVPTIFSSIPDPDPSPAPVIAEHTASILRDMLGFSDDEIKAMAAAEEVELPE